MRTCFHGSCVILKPWDHHGLRTPRSSVFPKPTVKQLSNAELLRIIRQDNEDATSTATVQTNPDSLEPKEHGLPNTRASLTAPRISRILQSPLTDRRLSAARILHRAVKPLPSRHRSLLQSKLQKNPYGISTLTCVTKNSADNVAAIALATPPRLCVLTSLRLPSYFQIPFGVGTHPKTGAPWHLPKLPVRAVCDPGDHEFPSAYPEGSEQSSLELDSSSMVPRGPARTLSSTNFLASRQVLAHISSLTPSKYMKLMPYRWKQDSSIKLIEVVWREDMDTFVLDILRRNISKSLSHLASRPAGYIIPCKTYDSINEHDQVAAVLWLRNDVDISTNDEVSTVSALPYHVNGTGPPPYAMHYHKTRYVPCYNLAALLSPIGIRALQESGLNQYRDQFAVVKRKRNTVKVQLELWKLLGYVIQNGKYGS